MYSIYLIPLLLGKFLAVNMGGSGTTPSFSAAFGSNLIRKNLIPGLFGLFVFLGALIGLGISKVGLKEILKNTPFKKILVIWLVAPLISLIISLVLTIISDNLGRLT